MNEFPDFHKYHALGNDYIVIDPNRAAINLTPDAVRMVCHRNFGIGSDGILSGPHLEGGVIRLRIFNPDGSEAEKSGNGIRIFARYLIDAGYVQQRQFEIVTPGGRVSVEVMDETAGLIKVDMGIVTFLSDKIPVRDPVREIVNEPLEVGGHTYRVTCLSIGNPHCVMPLEVISPELAQRIGPAVERHAQFPNRINVQLMKVLDRNSIQIEIWERGTGYTLASGSSSCAAASAAFRLGLVDRDVMVRMPGGSIDINIRDDGHVFMTGAVSGIMRGEFMDDLRARLIAGG